MKLSELKEFINSLPEEMNDFTVVNGEYGFVDPENEQGFIYRADKPVLAINVDEKDMEVVLLHQTREDLTKVDLGDI
jgi:hypothetical protein